MRSGAVFLDRDGTINARAEPHQHITDRTHCWILPGARAALAILAKNSERKIVIVTNQSCIGRGTATQAQVDALHAWLIAQIERCAGRIDAIYICPHAPWEGCTCRKPRPGLFYQAEYELGINLAQSAMIGDDLADLQAAWAAGVRHTFLIHPTTPVAHTGYVPVRSLLEAVQRLEGETIHDRLLFHPAPVGSAIPKQPATLRGGHAARVL